ncbi:unnamed protein product [Rotaria sp. Silwood2]|nr:unnamed protein product [Rotaria sp. Silwood2]
MYRFSYKVNQRRCIRRIKRQSVHKIIVPDSESSDNSHFSESKEDLLETHHQEQQPYEQISHMSISNEYDSFETSVDHLDDDINWISEEEYEDDKRPLYNGSSITVTNAVHRITNFYLNINLDKHKVNGLLRSQMCVDPNCSTSFRHRRTT